jgi:molecular chaperone GrpE
MSDPVNPNDPTDPSAAAASPRGEPQEVSTADEAMDLATVQADLEKFRDLALRAQADFENYRKRAVRERDDAVRYANSSLLEDLLPVIDNFELGLEAAKQQDPSSVIIQGMAMVQKQLSDFFASQSVTQIAAEPGDEFDPKSHDALGQEAHESIPEGRIIRQTRRGYKLKDRLLRPASVFVSKGPAQAS